jgi:hypothetical protein
MANLTYEERHQIYLEEKRKEEELRHSRPNFIPFLLIGAIIGVAGYFAFKKVIKEDGGDITIDDLRKAYEGLAPEDEE